MRDYEIQLLKKLRGDAAGVTLSSVAKRCEPIVESLRACGAVESVRSESGRGMRLRVANQSAFDRFVESRVPQGLDVDELTIANRAEAILHLADAKAFRGSVTEGILVRSCKPDIFVRSRDGTSEIAVSQLTQLTSCAALSLSPQYRWTFSGSVAVVENADAFWQHELVIPDADLAIFAGGLMSTRLVDWLASPAMQDCSIQHWGDYDPVGVAEYMRLRKACGDRVASFVPSDLPEMVKKFGKKELITKQVKTLEKLRSQKNEAHVTKMVAIFDFHRKGLEQELLLMQHNSKPT